MDQMILASGTAQALQCIMPLNPIQGLDTKGVTYVVPSKDK
jgi:hypothetical protein